MIILRPACYVESWHLIWAYCYLNRDSIEKKISKKGVLDFLRHQFSMFGTDHLAGDEWEYQYDKSELEAAEEWLQDNFPGAFGRKIQRPS